MTANPHLEHQTLRIKQLVEDYRAGRVVIPEFQRDYVWRRSKAARLVDSLYRGFPISSLLLWQSDEQTRARRRDPRPIHSSVMSWLIDGQQRVITLSRTMNGDEALMLYFTRIARNFVLQMRLKDRNWFRVAELWDDELYRQLRRNLDGSRQADKREERFEKLRRVLDYEVPVVKMVEHSFGDAVNAFTRINTLGVRLKHEDIESARIAARHSGFIADEVTPFLAELRRQGFNRLNIMHLFRACAFVAKPDGRNRTPLHELERTEVLKAWKTTQRATEQAIGLIRSEFGLVNMNILWSGALIVPLIAVCATVPAHDRDSNELAGWLALATLSHRYSGSSETALDQDLRACRSTDPVGALLSNLRSTRNSLLAEPNDFTGGLVDKSGLLSLYVACMNRGVLDLYMGGKVLLQRNVDRHHILPRAQFPQSDRSGADIVANIAFITGEVNKAISNSGPEVYLRRVKPRVLESQCIPCDRALWSIETAPEFWQARRELLAESFNDYIRKSLPNRRL